jgi:hypothetical protein
VVTRKRQSDSLRGHFISCNMTLSSTLRSVKGSLLCTSRPEFCSHVLYLAYLLHIPSLSSLVDYPNNVWYRSSCLKLLSTSEYSFSNLFLKHLESVFFPCSMRGKVCTHTKRVTLKMKGNVSFHAMSAYVRGVEV